MILDDLVLPLCTLLTNHKVKKNFKEDKHIKGPNSGKNVAQRLF